jgi:4-amino-4-deoxy-L-arabinose transferase-like glycosyltransferase
MRGAEAQRMPKPESPHPTPVGRGATPAAAGAGLSSQSGAIAAPRLTARRIGGGRARPALLTLRRPRPELVGLLALAAVLDLWALSRNGWANEYYSAAVRSMSSSWHNFLFASLDPSGVMTVDKPPLALWVQALSARVFGYHPLSLLIPQALMGVASVALVYDLTRRRFGRAAGFVAGLVLAVTPMTVAISRHNNPDALLVLCCVAALWFVVRALEDGRTRWLVLSGLCIGLGFETKMAVALLIVPGLAAAWMWVAPRGRIAAVRQLLAGGTAMLLVGGAWPALVALTPAASRPWISGTNDNSIFSLIFGYNGFGRVDGQAGGPQALGGGGGGGGGSFGGSSGPLRLLNASLGGQAGWLLGFAIIGGLAVAVASRLRRSDARSGWLIAVAGGFLATAAVFSFAQGIFHPYYVSLLAPFTAALVGAGAGLLTSSRGWARVLAPAAVVAGVAVEIAVLNDYPGQLSWLPVLLGVAGALTAVALAATRSRRARTVALAVALAALLIAPTTWAFDTLGHTTSGTFPAGGPQSASADGFGGPGGRPGAGFRRGAGFPGGRGFPGGNGPPAGGVAGGGAPPLFGTTGSGAARGGALGARLGGFGGPGGIFGGNSSALTQAAHYVAGHGGGTIAVSSQTSAAGPIIASGVKVAGIGGFSGRESSVSVSWFASAVQAGRIRWVLTDGSTGSGPPGDTRAGASQVMTAVAQTCRLIPGSAYSSGSTTAATGSSAGLYDCSGAASALAARA